MCLWGGQNHSIVIETIAVVTHYELYGSVLYLNTAFVCLQTASCSVLLCVGTVSSTGVYLQLHTALVRLHMFCMQTRATCAHC